MTSTGRITIAAVKPFSRWAVIPKELIGMHPAWPYYRRASAERRAIEHETETNKIAAAVGAGFRSEVLLLRKKWFGRFEIVDRGGTWDPLESTCRHASLSIL